MIEDFLQNKLKSVHENGLFRTLNTTILSNDGKIYKNGKILISFSCNNPLNLSQHPLVKEAAIKSIESYGIGSCASRLVTGNHQEYEKLEKKLAQYYKTEKALVFSSGYLANIGTISSIVNRKDMVIADRLVHSSIIDGIILSGAKLYRFQHNNILHCQELLKKYRNLHCNCLIIAEQVYSMDGDIAPTEELIKLAKEYRGWTLIDHAHSLGIVENNSNTRPDIYTGTLSKILGSLGGYVCASTLVIEYLQNKAKSFIYTTALPPSIVASANSALNLIKKYKETPINLAKNFCNYLSLPQPQSHIVPLIMTGIDEVIEAQKILEDHGFLVTAIRPPTSPSPRLRFLFCKHHSITDIEKLSVVVKSYIMKNSMYNIN